MTDVKLEPSLTNIALPSETMGASFADLQIYSHAAGVLHIYRIVEDPDAGILATTGYALSI